MKILVIHQNFPGQFRQLVPFLQSRGHEILGIASHDRPFPDNVGGWRYKAPKAPPVPMQLGQHLWYEGLQRAESVTHICELLNQKAWVPDVILAHSGWGETLGIKQVWPNVPQVIWPELWMKPEHGGYGLDPELPEPSLTQLMEQVGRNSMTRVALDQAAAWVMPTQHQANSLPLEFQDHRLHVIHEGIDTSFSTPDSNVEFTVRGHVINKSVPTITFVNRNLERLRGFDIFMRSLPSLLSEFPSLRVLIVGDNEKGYGNGHHSGNPLREVMLSELSGKLDLNRIHFLGRIPHQQLTAIMQASWVHVYLSYPFVLGWSLLEAMACGCSIVASKGMPCSEVLTHEHNALLVPISCQITLTQQISRLLRDSTLRSRLGNNAYSDSQKYDRSVTLPAITSLIESFGN